MYSTINIQYITYFIVKTYFCDW